MLRGRPAFVIDPGEVWKPEDTKDGRADLPRYTLALNDIAQGRILHIIDRRAESSEVSVTLDAALAGDVKSARRVDNDEAVEWVKEEGRITIKTRCNPVASVLLK